MPLARRYQADKMYENPELRGEWFTDTLDVRVITKDGNLYEHVFSNVGFFAHIYPMDTKSKAGDALRTFCQEFVVPEKLTFNGSKEQGQRKTEFMKILPRVGHIPKTKSRRSTILHGSHRVIEVVS